MHAKGYVLLSFVYLTYWLLILTKQAWSIKDLLYGIKHQNMIDFPGRTKPVSRAGKKAPCPLTELVIY